VGCGQIVGLFDQGFQGPARLKTVLTAMSSIKRKIAVIEHKLKHFHPLAQFFDPHRKSFQPI
jgi:hypothetical protein